MTKSISAGLSVGANHGVPYTVLKQASPSSVPSVETLAQSKLAELLGSGSGLISVGATTRGAIETNLHSQGPHAIARADSTLGAVVDVAPGLQSWTATGTTWLEQVAANKCRPLNFPSIDSRVVHRSDDTSTPLAAVDGVPDGLPLPPAGVMLDRGEGPLAHSSTVAGNGAGKSDATFSIMGDADARLGPTSLTITTPNRQPTHTMITKLVDDAPGDDTDIFGHMQCTFRADTESQCLPN